MRYQINRISMGFFVFFALFAQISMPSLAWSEAVINVVNLDGTGEGFNDASDPDADSTNGGNTGATLGEQRLKAFEYAANIWGQIIDSPVPIQVDAQMDEQFCSDTSAVLGAAGPWTVHRDFTGAPVNNTWYPQALANSLAGQDLDASQSDLVATFNSAIGTTCNFPIVWYYGLDAKPPAGTIDFVTVVLHEIGHGLGFLSLVDLASGRKFADLNDAYMRHLKNNDTGLQFPDMTDFERAMASSNTGSLHWTGSHVTAEHGEEADIYAPFPVQFGSSVSHFSNTLTPDQVMEPSYTGPNHDLGLAVLLFKDLGWSVGGDLDTDEEEEPVAETECGCNLPGAIVGTPGADNLRGTSGDDIICGLGGNDVIRGYAGNDCIEGGEGNDRIFGHRGDDTLYGGEGNDRIYAHSGADTLVGDAGNDRLYGGHGADILAGGEGNDRLYGHRGADMLFGGEGRDRIYGGSDDDLMFGEAGRDDLRAGRGNDELHGDEGNDRLRGDDGNDALYGGDDRDWLSGGRGDDQLDGGSGGSDTDFCRGGRGADTTVECELALP